MSGNVSGRELSIVRVTVRLNIRQIASLDPRRSQAIQVRGENTINYNGGGENNVSSEFEISHQLAKVHFPTGPGTRL
jgi:hypothetical protein